MNNRNKINPLRIITMLTIGGTIGGLIGYGILERNKKNGYRLAGIFEPGEHVVSVPIDDITEGIIVYKGHVGYKPIGINVDSLSEENNDSGKMLFVNTTEVKAEITGIDKDDTILYEDFGIPVDYTDKLGNNEYGVGQHIISVPCDCDDKLNIEYYDGYSIVSITRTTFCDNKNDGCILYVNEEPVEYNNENNSYFGTPVEKQKVLEK